MALKLLYTLDHEADRQVVHPRDTGTPHMQTYNYHKRADSRVKESVFIRVMRAFWGDRHGWLDHEADRKVIQWKCTPPYMVGTTHL